MKVIMLKLDAKKQVNITTWECTCPTCHAETVFTFVGQQTWPEAVAKSLNMPSVVNLWRCENCQTTITVTDEGAA